MARNGKTKVKRRVQLRRGLTPEAYQRLGRLVRLGEATWDELTALGYCKPPLAAVHEIRRKLVEQRKVKA